MELVIIAFAYTSPNMNTDNKEIIITSGDSLVFKVNNETVKIKFRVKTMNAVTFKIEAPTNIKIDRAKSYKGKE